MKTTKVILVLVIAVLFAASYVVRANALANENTDSASGDSTMTNHNHSGSSMTNGNQDGMMMNHNQGDSTMMGHGDMMAMMQKCQSMCGKMSSMSNNAKNNDANIDPGTKKGSYGYFQYQREKNKKIGEDK